MIICKRPAPADDQKQQQEKEEKEFLRADGQMDQPKVVQEVLADLKNKQWPNLQGDARLVQVLDCQSLGGQVQVSLTNYIKFNL